MFDDLEPVLCEYCERKIHTQELLDEDRDFCEYAGYIPSLKRWHVCEYYKEREYYDL